jgi:GT2 family glycosyltransferase
MQISVIIPTYNGAKKLPNILKALALQSYQDFETIVVVDGSTDDTLKVLEEGKNWNLKDFKYIYQENGGRAKVRNKGAKEAKGNVFIFFDDDTRPTPSCIEKLVKYFNEKKNAILVGNHPFELQKADTDLGKYRTQKANSWVKDLKPSPFLLTTPFMTAANSAIPKEIFEKLEGFDEKLTDAEDFDMAIRATEKQIPIYFCIDAVAWHDDFISCEKYIQRLKEYKKSHETLRSLKPDLYKKYPIYESSKPNFLKKMIYSFFANNFWVKQIDKHQFPINILPTSLRYKIYDLVITGLSVHFQQRKVGK